MNEKDFKQLIKEVGKDIPDAIIELRRHIKSKIRANLPLKNAADIEDTTQDTFLKIYLFLKKKPNIKYPKAWIEKIIKNSILDFNRKIKGERKKRRHLDMNSIGESIAKEELEGFSILERLSKTNPEIVEGFDISLRFIFSVFKLRQKIKSNTEKYLPLINDLNVLESLRGTVNNKLVYINDKRRLESLLENLETHIVDIDSELFAGIYHSGIMTPYDMSFTFADLLYNFHKIRIEPIKLIFRVWHKALRKGKYGKNKALIKILLEFKEKTKGTEKEFLFNSLNESVKADTLRKKSLYTKHKTNELYNRLTDYIFEKSFIDKKSIFAERINKFLENKSFFDLTPQEFATIEKMMDSA